MVRPLEDPDFVWLITLGALCNEATSIENMD
jgi:hypothetical protein